MSSAIQVANLGKKYTLRHTGSSSYRSLREDLSARLVGFGKRIIGQRTNATPNFEEFWAIREVTLEIEQGERLGIIGRNGAGKSTFLKLLSRITQPTTGKIHTRGRVGSLLEVGTGFHPEMTGRENIFLNGAILGMGRAEIRKKFDEIVAFADIENFLDTPVKRYSSGMYVRLAFSVAAHLEPEILIVDEVLAVGDAEFQKKCLGKMETVGQEGRTVLFVSHNLTAIRSLCNRAVLLAGGKVALDGQPNEVTAAYLQRRGHQRFSREWPQDGTAPENDNAILESIRILSSHGERIEEIDTDTGFQIEIVFRTKTEGARVGLTTIIHDDQDQIVFSSINNHEPNWYGKPMPEGTYRSTCTVPRFLMNNGWHHLSVILFGKGFSDAVITDDTLRWDIVDGPFVRGDFLGQCGGAIRPLLEWKTNASTVQNGES